MSLKCDEREHSLEMHLPFIRTVMQGHPFKLIPILVGSPSKDQEDQIADALMPYFQDDRTLFIISSDFCHWGRRFAFTRCEAGMPIYESIKDLDLRGMSFILEFTHLITLIHLSP